MARKLRDVLTEAPWINDEISERKPKQVEVTPASGEHISKMGKGYNVLKNHLGDTEDGKKVTYTVADRRGNVHVRVHGNENGNRLDVTSLYAPEGNKVEAHDFYHHLITQHGIHLHSDYEQSEGGMKVWKRLQKMPGIHMQSWNGSDQKYRELKPSFQRTYDMDSSTRLAAKKRGT
jgi:hypothetical protein